MKPKVYIETSIPSFYVEIRTELDMVARREWTHIWWNQCRDNYEQALELLKDVPLLAIEEPIMEIVEAYIKHKLMPHDPLGDALHLAITSYHRCDFLLTWNCKHIANANKNELL